MKTEANVFAARPPVARMLESVLGCKWSLSVLDLVRRGIVRPGAMRRAVPGLSTKVLNERLRKLCGFGILTRTAYPEVPPRVEYHLTPFGRRFVGLLDQIAALEEEAERGFLMAPAATRPAAD